MDAAHALRIVSALANGANPITGEVISPESPYQAPDIIRALFIAVRALEQQVEYFRLSPPTPTPRIEKSSLTSTQARSNAGKPWTPDEDQQLLAAFDANTTIVEIARAHARTVNGVRARLEKHGKLESTTARWSHQSAKAAESNPR